VQHRIVTASDKVQETDVQGCFSTLCMLYVCVKPEQKQTIMLDNFDALQYDTQIHSHTRRHIGFEAFGGAAWVAYGQGCSQGCRRHSTRECKVRVTCLSRRPHWLCHWTRCCRGSVQGASALHRHKGAICRRRFDALHQICRQNLVPTLHSTRTNLCQLHMRPMTETMGC